MAGWNEMKWLLFARICAPLTQACSSTLDWGCGKLTLKDLWVAERVNGMVLRRPVKCCVMMESVRSAPVRRFRRVRPCSGRWIFEFGAVDQWHNWTGATSWSSAVASTSSAWVVQKVASVACSCFRRVSRILESGVNSSLRLQQPTILFACRCEAKNLGYL